MAGRAYGGPHLDDLARRWAKGLGVLFAVGAVSGTILSFELGILWPGFMGRFGEVIGLPFAIRGHGQRLDEPAHRLPAHAGRAGRRPGSVGAMLNPATPVQTTHMILAAFMVAGFGVAAVYATGWLRGRRDRYHRLGFVSPFTVAAVSARSRSVWATGPPASWPTASRSSSPPSKASRIRSGERR